MEKKKSLTTSANGFKGDKALENISINIIIIITITPVYGNEVTYSLEYIYI
jgi:hypothetical protein